MVMGDVIFTGDAYIPGVGVNTIPPKSNKKQAKESLERILKLAEGKTILSGHYVKWNSKESMANAYVFPSQWVWFVVIGKDLYESNAKAKELFDNVNDILGYRITEIMLEVADDDLKQTKVTHLLFSFIWLLAPYVWMSSNMT